MAAQLESALVIALRDTIRWESAVDAPSSGTLTPVNPDLPFDCKVYQERDRQLAYRDLIVGAAVVEVSVQVGDVYNYSTLKPSLQGPTPFTLPFVGTEAGTFSSQIRHVTNVSIPYDAARYADADLYGRDALVYEVLARACASAFVDPSIPQAGTDIPSTSIWSLGQGAAMQADINAVLPLNRDLFKNPDRNLADRDNQLAGYVARLAQVLKNPFEHALRLYVQVESFGTVQQEADIYALISDNGTRRVFQSEPALPGANEIIYDTQSKTLQWIRERVDEVHVPQIYAMVIPGIAFGQYLETLAHIPERMDPQYWRGKAGLLKPEGMEVADTDLCLTSTNNDSVAGGLMQSGSVSFSVPDDITFSMIGTLPAAGYRVSVLSKPNGLVELAGAQNTSDTSGTLGGATFDINVVSGSVSNKVYVVENGDGIVYNGSLYLPGDPFSGTNTVPTYAQYGVVPSTVRQYALNFGLALPLGSWSVALEYTNLSGTTDGFRIKAQYVASGADAVTVIQDTAPIPFTATNGNIAITSAAGVDVDSIGPFTFPIYWTGGNGELHIRKVTFEKTDVSTARFAITGSFVGSTAYADVNGENKTPDVLRWQFVSMGTHTGTVPFIASYTEDATLPIQLQQVQVQTLTEYQSTPLSRGFQSWRQECLDRSERVVQQGYALALADYGTDTPTFRDSGSYWTPDASENWMSFTEVCTPRLREVPAIAQDGLAPGRQYEVDTTFVVYNGTTFTEGQKFYATESAGTAYSSGTVHQVGAFMKSKAGHVGKPALMPRGLYFDEDEKKAKAYYDTLLSTPVLVACQPWMIEQGIYVAQSDFWMPEALGLFPPTIPVPDVVVSSILAPPGSAVILGLGTYRYGSVITLTAIPALMPATGYVDVVFLVDCSGSMLAEQAWLGRPPGTPPFLPSLLESALVAAGIGAGIDVNSYAMVGFGTVLFGPGQKAFKIAVGGGDWGTASQLETAAAGLVTNGSNEDGYEAMDFALSSYAYRPGAVKLFILITDEGREDLTAGVVTKASITAALQAAEVQLACVVNAQITDIAASPAIGRKGTTVYIKDLSPPYYLTSTLNTIVSGDLVKDVVVDYCQVAEVVPDPQPLAGSEWDLEILRNGGSDATAFTSAFVDVTKNQILTVLSYTFGSWVINGNTYLTNPVSFVVLGDTVVTLNMT